MKKIKLLLPLFILLGFLHSCIEDDSSAVKDSVAINNDIIGVVDFKVNPSASLKGGGELATTGVMLSFPSFQEFKTTLETLEAALEAHQEAFYSQYEHLSEDEIDSIADAVGFNDQQPLVDFENSKNFSNSLRRKFNAAEAIWLNNENLDIQNDPIKNYPYDELEQALLNENQEVMIGGVVYVYRDAAVIYQINQEHQQMLSMLANGQDISNNPNVTTTDKAGYSCTLWKEKTFTKYYNNGSRMIKEDLIWKSGTHHTRAISKISNYKKKGNRWKPRVAKIALKFNIDYYDRTSCVTKQGHLANSLWTPRSRRSRTIRKDIWLNTNRWGVRNNESYIAQFKYPGTQEVQRLTW